MDKCYHCKYCDCIDYSYDAESGEEFPEYSCEKKCNEVENCGEDCKTFSN